ncbi:MAG: AraC-like DNA-binding protein [Zhongshania sp.]|jgi:AraC-like DNA-binding protein
MMAMTTNRLQNHLLTQILNQLERAQVPPGALFIEAGFPDISTAGQLVAALSGPDALPLLEAATKLTKNPCLALQLSEGVNLDLYGTLGFALMSCANMRTSTKLLLRYGKLQFSNRWEAHERGDDILLRLNFDVGTQSQQQIIKELYLSTLTRVANLLYRGAPEGAEIHLDYPQPAHHACYRNTFNTPVKFNCEYTQLFIPGAILDKPIRSANIAGHVIFHQQCEEMLRSLESAEEITTAVRLLLIKSAGEFLEISQVATSLHMSERTLRRQLEAESSTFRAIVDDIRNLLAKEYLSATPLAVAEIAHLLGYGETVNFRRAFVRWNKLTPSQFREQLAS